MRFRCKFRATLVRLTIGFPSAILAHMAIFFGYKTAEHILNSVLAPEFQPSAEAPNRYGSVDDLTLEKIDFSLFELPENEPLDIVVPSHHHRRLRKALACHISSGDLPHGAYLRVFPDVYVASPALCLLQRSSDLTFAGAIKLAARFCGTYAPSKTDRRGFITRQPLATPEDLDSFVKLCPTMRGKRLALCAIKWTLPNAASPMETEMAMPFYLSQRVGAFGLPRPTMNYERTLSPLGVSMTGKKMVRIDIYWPDAGFGFEYQSELLHRGDERYGQDIGRQLAIESMGDVIRMVTIEQLRNPAQLEYLARLVAEHVGVTLQPERGKALRADLVNDILSD